MAEIEGAKSAGKATLILQTIAGMQQRSDRRGRRYFAERNPKDQG